jgi:outer membrane protein OmpA-like peptidoglycan-associated protein
MNRKTLLTLLMLISVLAAAGGRARAETVEAYRDGDAINPDDVVRILSPAPVLTRSIRTLVANPRSGDNAGDNEAVPQRAGALSIPVAFDFDSAGLQPAARQQLDAIAEGIRRLPAQRHVVIEGHTDATGTDDYNLALSARRAAAVRDYLVRVQGIDAARLGEVGAGKREPLPGRDPYAAENRRVQFRGE